METAVAYLEALFRNFSGVRRKTTNKARLVVVPIYIHIQDFQDVIQKVCVSARHVTYEMSYHFIIPLKL